MNAWLRRLPLVTPPSLSDNGGRGPLAQTIRREALGIKGPLSLDDPYDPQRDYHHPDRERRWAKALERKLANPPEYEYLSRQPTPHKIKPNPWWYYLWLRETYETLFEFVEALKAAAAAHHLQPNDPRSTYGLASCYRALLSQSWYFSQERYDRFKSSQAQYKPQEWGDFLMKDWEEAQDPKKAQQALQDLGLTVEDTARLARKWLHKTLELGVRTDEKHWVEDAITSLILYLPADDLVQSLQNKTSSALLAEIDKIHQRGGERILGSSDDKVVAQFGWTGGDTGLTDVVLLLNMALRCQLCLEKDPTFGDAYILLAHILWVPYLAEWVPPHIRDRKVTRITEGILSGWAAGIIAQWKKHTDELGMGTQRTELGEKVYAQIRESGVKPADISRITTSAGFGELRQAVLAAY